MSASFAAWASDTRRSLEERFGAQILIEQTINHWRSKHDIKHEVNYEAERLRRKERSLNPAYEPEFTRSEAECVEEVLPEIKTLRFELWDDRPVRDLSVLQFCPAVESLHTYRTEVRDWQPLVNLPSLRDLHLSDSLGRDFRPIAALTKLESIHIWVDSPWPDMTGFDRLTQLAEFDFRGNLLALSTIPCLPGLQHAKFHQSHNLRVPLRRIGDLPEMPQLRRLYLENTWQLDGIERSPHLINLEVYGYFDNLTPLSALQELTHLILSGGEYTNLAPVALLPQLQRLVLRREESFDLSVLAEAPRLHELRTEMCPVQKEEVAILNATLSPWAEEFAIDPPRPLQPFRLFVRGPEDHPQSDSTALPRNWGHDKEMAASEARWFARQINRRLTALLGKGWGGVDERYCDHPGNDHVVISRREDIDRLPEIVQTLRQLLAGTRHPWTYLFVVNTLAEYERELDEIVADGEEEEAFDAEREREEWEYLQEQKRERREYLEREYRYRLRQEQGLPTPSKEFAPPSKDPESTGQVQFDDAGEYDLGTELHLYATLTEVGCYVAPQSRELAELLLEVKAEE